MKLSIKNVITSISNKYNIVSFTNELIKRECNIYSTGGTFDLIKYNLKNENNNNLKTIESLTNTPELFNGRVKTLHPSVFAGLLTPYKKHEDLQKLNTVAFDLVNVNLYPFD